jgi:hypothetical protein
LLTAMHEFSWKNAASVLLATHVSGKTQTHPNAGIRDDQFRDVNRELLDNRTPPGGAPHANTKASCGRGFGIRLRP